MAIGGDVARGQIQCESMLHYLRGGVIQRHPARDE